MSSLFGPSGSQSGRRTVRPDRPKGRKLGALRHLGSYLAPYRLAMAGALVALIVSAGSVLAMGIGLRLLFDRGIAGSDAALLHEALLFLLAMVLLLTIGTYARFLLVSWLGERVIADLRRTIHARLLRLGPAFFEITKVGEIVSRLTTDTALIQALIGNQASSALRNFLLMAGGIAMLLVTSPKLTALVVVLVPIVVVPILALGRRVRRYSRLSQDKVAALSAGAEESFNALQTIQAFGHEALERARFGDRVENAFRAAFLRIRARALLTALVILIVFLGVGAVLWMGGHDVVGGKLSGGELSAFLFYAVVVAGSVGSLSEVYGDLQYAAGAAERLAELAAVEPAIKSPANPKRLPEPAKGAVAIDNVTFHYPSRPERAALTDFSLRVEPGERVALVGPSGAGKTTVFNLLLRFHDPQSGGIRIDGVDLREADLQEARRRFGLVPQDAVIFAATAAENIRFGRPDATDAEVRAAAAAAQAASFIEALPEGYGSFLGEKGMRLSGGQKQRIAIARAILRNPAVLLLDEATSALDAESERAVQLALERLMVGRTTIVIAHRLATVLKADRIAVLDEGRLVATGRHEQLIAAGGLYARLAALQFTNEPG